ncbi:MAG: hypothetical protein WCQ16_01270 [Verrucomicrobiae bacterium]
MKTILTHIAAFIAGVITLPVVLFITVKAAPDAIPHLAKVLISRTTSRAHGSAALKTAKTEEERFYFLGAAAKEEFNKGNIGDAKKYATELSTLTPKYTKNWNYGNAIQDSNLVLGRIAIRDGNIEAAKVYLSEEAKSPGSPQMDSFGPNVSLAKDLLEKGETEVVVSYFTACKIFWKMQNGKLDDWIASAKAGNIPDFGANLVY